jgi:hypothetical protein
MLFNKQILSLIFPFFSILSSAQENWELILLNNNPDSILKNRIIEYYGDLVKDDEEIYAKVIYEDTINNYFTVYKFAIWEIHSVSRIAIRSKNSDSIWIIPLTPINEYLSRLFYIHNLYNSDDLVRIESTIELLIVLKEHERSDFVAQKKKAMHNTR